MSGSTLKYVNHTYRDYSRYIEEGGQLIKHKKSEANFPAKLHKVLSEPSHCHVITWAPHGRAWKILDKNLLFQLVIPQYFVCKKYESFTRQLNGWGFKRLHQSGPDLGCYYHECFLRDLPKLTCLIRRLPTNQGKTTPYPAGEPNFYRISEQLPLPPLKPSNSSSKSSAAEAAATKSAARSLYLPPRQLFLKSDRAQRQIQYPSPSLTQPLTQEVLTSYASAASALPSRGDLHEPSPVAPISVSAATAHSSLATARENSHEAQYPTSSLARPLSQEYSVAGLTASTTMPYESSHQMAQYAQDYRRQPSNHSSYSNVPNYPPVNRYSSDHYGSTYGQYPTQGQPSQYQLQSFWHPQDHHYPPTYNGASIEEYLPHANYNNYHGSNMSAEPSVPPYSARLTNNDGNKSYPDQSFRQESHGTLESMPYSSSLEEELIKGFGSSVYKTS